MGFSLDPEGPRVPSRREQIAREALAAFDDEGPAALVRTLTEDVVWVEDPGWPASETWRGRDAVMKGLSERLDSTRFRATVEEIDERGDLMLVLQRWVAEGSASGAQAELQVAVLNSWRGDLVERTEFFLDQGRARAAFYSNEELVRQAVAVFDTRELDGLMPYLTEDVVWREDPGRPGASTYGGREGVRAAAGRLLEAMAFESEIEELVERGGRVLVRLQRGSVLFTMRDGLIARVESFFDPERARAALEAE
jgi:ketosteroid isomerase-like protein